jgi:hypothetical protein
MPRTARASVPGTWHHVLNRGNRREEVFHKPADYDAFVKAMADANTRLAVDVLQPSVDPDPAVVGSFPEQERPAHAASDAVVPPSYRRIDEMCARYGHDPVSRCERCGGGVRTTAPACQPTLGNATLQCLSFSFLVLLEAPLVQLMLSRREAQDAGALVSDPLPGTLVPEPRQLPFKGIQCLLCGVRFLFYDHSLLHLGGYHRNDDRRRVTLLVIEPFNPSSWLTTVSLPRPTAKDQATGAGATAMTLASSEGGTWTTTNRSAGYR